VLFAEREDAKRAYRGLGFVVVGEYALVLFDSQRRAHLCSS
jgi:hypothetical protein